MIATILSTLASVGFFTAVGVGEQELRDWLGRMGRQKLAKINARLQNALDNVDQRNSQISIMKSALQSMGFNLNTAASASKLRAHRTAKQKELNDEEKKNRRDRQTIVSALAENEQKSQDTYTYGGAASALMGKEEMPSSISKWEDPIK